MNDAEPLAKTKIIATVGPACLELEMLRSLVQAGVDIFRLNMAHGDFAQREQIIANIRRLEHEHGPLGILIDLAGPKIRLNEIDGERIMCLDGQMFRFANDQAERRPGDLHCNYPQVIDELQAGDKVQLADGTVTMVVTATSPGAATCRVVSGGPLRIRQGVAFPGASISVPTLTTSDIEAVEWAAGQAIDFVSLSFVRVAAEILQLKQLLKQYHRQVPVIAKIEKREALEDLPEIVEVADGVMVARGDLGVEIDVAEIPVVQKRIIQVCNDLQKPVIVATQMLDSMQNSPHPTRAEATDVANAVLDGADACMLSGETAIGDYPLPAARMMNRILVATENLLCGKQPRRPSDRSTTGAHEITLSVVYGAGRIAEFLKAKLMIVVSRSGATALTRSNQRGFVPTVGVSQSAEILRRMTLYWGITPLAGAPLDRIELQAFVVAWGKRQGLLSTGDRVVVVAGTNIEQGAHNTVVVFEAD